MDNIQDTKEWAMVIKEDTKTAVWLIKQAEAGFRRCGEIMVEINKTCSKHIGIACQEPKLK